MELNRVRAPERLRLETLRPLVQALGPGPLVLEGASDGVFCLGMDLEAALTDDAREGLAWLAEALWRLSERSLAAAVVDGDAVGGGVGLLSACTLVVATPRARFSLPELALGLTPAAIWPALRGRASRRSLIALATHACPLDAEGAARIGLVDVVTDEPARYVKNLRRIDPDAHRRLRGMSRFVEGEPDERVRASAMSEARSQLEDPAVRRRIVRYLEGDAPWA